MFEPTFLDYVPLWAFFLTTFAVALAASECGYRWGRRLQSKTGTQKKEAIGSIVGATFGLLAFLLAFTFGLAASRYERRREMFQEEVNTIGTTYLRASFLQEPHGAKVRALLREYVDVRLEVSEQKIAIADGIRRSEKLQNALWQHTVEVGRNLDKPGAPNSDLMALFVASLNQMIDAQANRIAAVARGRVPTMIWIALMILTVIALFIGGCDVGITGATRPIVGLGMIVGFALTMWLIADLDRPGEGLIRVGQQGMIDLRASMNEESP